MPSSAKVEELVLLDEACDQPADMDWDRNVSCGEVPNAIYEAFDDYMEYRFYEKNPTNSEEYGLSSKFVEMLDRWIKNHGIDAEKFDEALHTATVLFSSGREQEHALGDGCRDELATAVCQIYESGELFGDEMVEIETVNGEEVLINFKNIAMIKLPLAKMESAINTMLDDMEEELE